MSEFDEENNGRISFQIIGAIYEVHKLMGTGLLEECYQKALAHELRLRGLKVEEQIKVPVIYKGVEIKDSYVVDILVEDKIIIELKSVEALARVHFKQLLTYLSLKDLYFGFLVNFNTDFLSKKDFKKVYNNNASLKVEF